MSIQDLQAKLHDSLMDLEALENSKEFTGETIGVSNQDERAVIVNLLESIETFVKSDSK